LTEKTRGDEANQHELLGESFIKIRKVGGNKPLQGEDLK